MTKKEDNIKHNKKEIMASLINLFKWCLDLLRNQEHITGKEALKIITTLLSYKLIENKIDWSNYKIDLSIIDIGKLDEKEVKERIDTLYKNVKFSNYAINDDDNYNMSIMNIWDLMLAKHEKTKEIFKLNKHTILSNLKNETLKKLIKKINKIKLEEDEDLDINGAAYEEVIKDIMTGKVLGQYFTQSMVKNIVIDLIKPKMNESIYDPAMGTGGFLISAVRYLKKNNKDFDISKINISGREADEDTYQLAMANMLISLGETINLEKGDSLREVIRNNYDVIMANPPFGIKGIKYEELKNYNIPLKSSSSVNLFIQLIINILNKNGRAGVVLPDGKELFSNSKELKKIREYLLKTCEVKEIIYLPNDSFTYTTIRTCVIYFIKKKEEEEVILKKNKWIEEYETKSIKFYEYDNNEKKLLIEVKIKELIEKNLSLNYKLYLKKEEIKKENKNTELEYKSIGEICEFLPKSKRSASYGNKEGKYPFYKSSMKLDSYVDEVDYEEESIIIGDGGEANINFNNKFSCSDHCYIIHIKDNKCKLKYIYYYLVNNIKLLQDGFTGVALKNISKNYIKNIKIPIPSKDRQEEIINYLELINETNNTSQKKIIELKKLNEYYIKREMKNEIKYMSIGEICEINYGTRIVKKKNTEGDYPVFGSGRETFTTNTYNREGWNILIGRFALSFECVRILNKNLFLNDSGLTIKSIKNYILDKYLGYYLHNNQNIIYECARGTAQKNLDIEEFKAVKIPILSKEKQEEIINYCEYNDTLIKQLEDEIKNNKLQMKKIISDI
jgi:type I restriction-modification system DNA methylase subunit